MIWVLYIYTMVHFGNQGSVESNRVIKDFGGENFDATRFNREIVLVQQDEQTLKYDSISVQRKKVKDLWIEVNSLIRRCDYIVEKDTTCKNVFLIFSNKAYQRILVRYDGRDKVSFIKITKPKVKMHLIPPPCGY